VAKRMIGTTTFFSIAITDSNRCCRIPDPETYSFSRIAYPLLVFLISPLLHRHIHV